MVTTIKTKLWMYETMFLSHWLEEWIERNYLEGKTQLLIWQMVLHLENWICPTDKNLQLRRFAPIYPRKRWLLAHIGHIIRLSLRVLILSEWRPRFFTNQRAWVAAEAVTMTQLQVLGNFAERFMAAVTPISFILLGNLSAQLHEALAGLNPRYLKLADGFSR